ncbi:MAG: tRNA uracil 4-sulfurtransferase ThiI [Verrucomicrobiia bacterium]
MDLHTTNAPPGPAVLHGEEELAHSILIHFGELGLKGRNQPMFRRQLRRNIRVKLRGLEVTWMVEDSAGLFSIHVPAEDAKALQPAVAALREVFGIVWLACARRLRPVRFTPETQERDWDLLQRNVLDLAQRLFSPGKTFAVRVNRGNKLLPFKSPDVAALLGESIRTHTPWKEVNLTQPDVTFDIDLRCAATFLFAERFRGPAGLPVGTAGRVLALLSGGIDSPVAAWMMAKRGCRVDFIHFSASSMAREEILQSKVWRLACQLSRYTLGARLFVVPYTYFDLALLGQKLGYELVLFRRFMVRVAEKLAVELRSKALVTGDNLSQVASQTMTNLVSTSQATGMEILRPIVAFDKDETITLAQKIGTYDISVEPYKDCCALIASQPKTRSHPERLDRLESRAFPEYAKLVELTLADAVCLDIPAG